MKIIHDNPYRIAGILSNATAKEFEKQKGKIRSNAKTLVSWCKSKLQNIRNILRLNDEFYLNISSAVVSGSLQRAIDIINEGRIGRATILDYCVKVPVVLRKSSITAHYVN
jgi:hypothetical protein